MTFEFPPSLNSEMREFLARDKEHSTAQTFKEDHRMKKWLPILLTVAGTLVTALSPAVQGFWGHHPEVASGVIGGWAVVKGLLPSPLQGDK
jgi:hypothetical protein